MRRLPQAYFAYGSNLCVYQMSQRCPDAYDPQPALLSDHGWLINQRGVATIQPQTGCGVHGVLWWVSHCDLASLDSAEGVPVRYRREQRTVHTTGGPSPAWVYIDYRVNPGPARPGYLEHVIDGARQQRLPPHWIDFLRGWESPASAMQKRFAAPPLSPRSSSPAHREA